MRLSKLQKRYHWTMYKLYCHKNGLNEGNYKSVLQWRNSL